MLVSAQCSLAMSGFLNTLQPYTAPRQICMMTAATAMPQRLGSFSVSILALLRQDQAPARARGRLVLESIGRGGRLRLSRCNPAHRLDQGSLPEPGHLLRASGLAGSRV